jgi:hypothetical protein
VGCRRRVAAVFSGLLGLDVIVDRCRELGLKINEETLGDLGGVRPHRRPAGRRSPGRV